MVTKYKLPAPDGTVLLVEARQAGQTLRTAGGTEVPVPTLLELRRLERVEQGEPNSGGSAWSMRQGGLFVGGVVLLLLGATVGTMTFRGLPAAAEPTTPGDVMEASDLSSLRGGELYEAWIYLSEMPLEEMPRSYLEEVAAARRRGFAWMAAAGLTAAVGLGLITAACLMPAGRKP